MIRRHYKLYSSTTSFLNSFHFGMVMTVYHRVQSWALSSYFTLLMLSGLLPSMVQIFIAALYISCSAINALIYTAVLLRCINDVHVWMLSHRLRMNAENSQFILLSLYGSIYLKKFTLKPSWHWQSKKICKWTWNFFVRLYNVGGAAENITAMAP